MKQPQPFLPVARTQPSANAEHALTLLGPSSTMAQLWGQIRRLAPHVRTVLLTGEPDCGQEAVARLLLDLSPHPHRAFVQITAAEAEASLLRPTTINVLAAEVFLFLPDVDRFSLAAQDGLLRLLRQRRSRPFTIVASAREDLRSLVGVGRFCSDLADALSAVRIALPTLRQRTEDIPMLAAHMLAAASKGAGVATPHTTEEFLQAAMQHAWPGNLRELSQTLSNLCASARGEVVRAADLHRTLVTLRPNASETAPAVRLVPLDTVVQEHINAVLRACQGNKVRASEVLGISRSTLYRMLDSTPIAPRHDLAIAS